MSYYLRTITLFCFICLISPANAHTHGSVTIEDPQGVIRSIIYEKTQGYAVVEGDILLGKIDDLKNKGAVILPKINGLHWPHGIIPYVVNDDLPFPNQLAVFQAIDYWQKHSHLKFININSQTLNDYPDFIAFTRVDGTECSSFVGKIGGKQPIHLSLRCSTMTTVHEIGHALGMWHEQSRADRDSYVRILWENIQEGHQYNFDQQLTDGKDFGDYDYQSIMHYGQYAFSKNGQKTIIPLIDGVEIGQRTHLSEKDMAAINDMYPEN